MLNIDFLMQVLRVSYALLKKAAMGASLSGCEITPETVRQEPGTVYKEQVQVKGL